MKGLMMDGFIGNIKDLTNENGNFRKVLFTAPHSQLVVMSLRPGEDIGVETHKDNDQFIRIEEGIGRAVLGGVGHDIEGGSAVVVPAGVEHNIVNVSDTEEMKLYTIYSPANHPEGTVHTTKEDAMEME